MISIGRSAVFGLLLIGGGSVRAQNAPPQTIPGLDNFTIERPQPAPLPTPRPTPTPAATPVPVPPGSPVVVLPPVRPTPRDQARSEPGAAATPISRAAASPPAPAATRTLSPTASPSPVVTSPARAATPAPVAPINTPPFVPAAKENTVWPWLLGAALVAIGLVAAFLLGRRRPKGSTDRQEISTPVSEAPPPPAPRAADAPPPTPRAISRLTITLHPLRAGLNLLSATAECEVVVANTGDRPATDIRLALRLLSAGIGQEADLSAAFAEPIVRPMAPPFTLRPGEERRVRTVAALPRDAIRPMTAAGRPMFVPLVAVNLLYGWGDASAQTAQAFAIGVERADSAKLAPLWLDTPPKMHDAVGARPHAVAIER